MNILYGVQTTGNGHLIRSQAMIRALRSYGHTVYTLFSGDPDKTLRNLKDFEPCTVKKGLTFCTEQGRICYLKTAKRLDLPRFYADIRSFRAEGFDLVVTDYEPLTARIAQRWSIPSIGIGHLYAFDHPVPLAAGCLPGSRTVMGRFAPVDIPLGLHWHHFDQPILPPTIPDDVFGPDQADPNTILVYLPFENLGSVTGLLKRFPDYRFRIYSRCTHPGRNANLELRPLSREGFLADLANCSGVLCNAGFSLVSEALHLGKKILTKPLAGQIEQCSNAKALQLLALGSVMHSLNHRDLATWLQQPSPPAQAYPDVIGAVAGWIHAGNWDAPQELASGLWNRQPSQRPGKGESGRDRPRTLGSWSLKAVSRLCRL
jgi:uncharacterized protein (TIGR00661 family)